MFETLKELINKDTLSIDDKNVISMSGEEDFTIHDIRIYTQDEGEILIMDLGDYFLIAHTFGGDPRYYFHEIKETGTIEDLEELGIKLIDDNDDFKERMKIKTGHKSIICKLYYGPVYNLIPDKETNADEDEINFCEYRTSCKHSPALAIEEKDENFTIYQGIRINESNIII